MYQSAMTQPKLVGIGVYLCTRPIYCYTIVFNLLRQRGSLNLDFFLKISAYPFIDMYLARLKATEECGRIKFVILLRVERSD